MFLPFELAPKIQGWFQAAATLKMKRGRNGEFIITGPATKIFHFATVDINLLILNIVSAS